MGRLLRLGGALCSLIGVLVLVVSFSPLVAWMTRGLAVDWFEGDADVLVVLGGSMLVDGTGPQATLGYDSYLRCTYALWTLQRHHYKSVVLTGGNGLAENMAKLLAAGGIDARRMLIENSAHSTYENAAFVQKILQRQFGAAAHPSIAILTSDYHSRRARLIFDRLGMNVRVIPVPDVAKQTGRVDQRWGAFWRVIGEFAKTALYRLNGKI